MSPSDPQSQRFNLVDEAWLPVSPKGLASLKEIFQNPELAALTGPPHKKIALLKLLLAVAQAAITPEDDEEWLSLGKDGLGRAVAGYLDKHHDLFYLYGPRPFLQMPLEKARLSSFGIIQPEIATGNNPRLTHMQCEQPLSDAEKAQLLVTVLSMCMGGKGGRGDNSFSFSKTITKKSPRPGPGLGFLGYLHTFLKGSSILETVWLNLLTKEHIEGLAIYPEGLGVAPWEEMPRSEDCEIAERLKNSLMGRLVPLARFCLLGNDKLHLTEGIAYPGHKDGIWDPSVSGNSAEFKVLWTNPDMRPWRTLAARLSVLQADSATPDYECFQIRGCLPRALNANLQSLGIWSGGIRVRSNSGEQFLSGTDDILQSEIRLTPAHLGSSWHAELASQMEWLNHLNKMLYGCVMAYSQDMVAVGKKDNDSAGPSKAKSSKNVPDHLAKSASAYFWEKGEKLFPELLLACHDLTRRSGIREKYANLVEDAYNLACPACTARQIEAWAKNRPRVKIRTSQDNLMESMDSAWELD